MDHKRKWLAGAATSVLMTVIGGCAVAQESAAETEVACSARSHDAAYEMIEVRENGLVATYFQPEGEGPHPAILALGGSEGGIDSATGLGRGFADAGYAVLSLAYFAAEDLPDQLINVPLEYVDAGVDWLADRAEVDADRLGVYGISKGGELSLLLASRDPRLAAVGAGVPSHTVWQGINMRSFTAVDSSWTENGEPVAFQTFAVNTNFANIRGFYEGVYEGDAANADAVIAVENINGPVLLVSAGQDAIWPSAPMSQLVVDRLEEAGFEHPVTHLTYPDAGHAAGMPSAMGALPVGTTGMFGGTPEANEAARADMWPQLVCFYDQALGYGEIQ